MSYAYNKMKQKIKNSPFSRFNSSNNNNLQVRTEFPKPKRRRKATRSNGKKTQKIAFLEDLETYNALYLFSYKDIRKHIIQDISITEDWKDSKIWFGKNKIIVGALGNQKQESTEKRWPGLSQLVKQVKGQSGLLLTNRPYEVVKDWFDKFSAWDYPHPGYEIDITIKLNQGPLPQFSIDIEPYLKKLGMPTTVENGAVVLTSDFQVCEAGTLLTPTQNHYLELLGEKLSLYKIKLKAMWTKEHGFTSLKADEESDDDEGDNEELDEDEELRQELKELYAEQEEAARGLPN